jgi:hypothetical protein
LKDFEVAIGRTMHTRQQRLASVQASCHQKRLRRPVAAAIYERVSPFFEEGLARRAGAK